MSGKELLESTLDVVLSTKGPYRPQLQSLEASGILGNKSIMLTLIVGLCELVDEQALRIQSLEEAHNTLASTVAGIEKDTQDAFDDVVKEINKRAPLSISQPPEPQVVPSSVPVPGAVQQTTAPHIDAQTTNGTGRDADTPVQS